MTLLFRVNTMLRQKSGGTICLKVVRPNGSADVHTSVFLEVGISPEDGAAVGTRVGNDVTPV